MNTIYTKCCLSAIGLRSCKKWELLRVHRNICYRVAFISNVRRIENPYLNEAKLNDFEILHFQTSVDQKLSFHLQFWRLLTTSRNRCWKCNAVVTERDLVCLSCGCVQEPKQNLNYFEIFKEVPHFDIDVRNLTVKFRRLQTMLHPDKIATRSEKEQQYSMEQSSKVNRAYQLLYHPLERGLYLLELHGKPLLEGEISMPNDFLEDVMDINEQLQESSPQVVESIRHVNNAKLEVLFAELSQAFKEKNIDRAREILAKLKYFVNLDSQIKKKEEELGMSRDD